MTQDPPAGPPVVPGLGEPYTLSTVMPAASPPPRRKSRAALWVVLAGVAVLVIAAGVFAALKISGVGQPTALRTAKDKCAAGEISDGDKTLFLDMAGKDPNSGDFTIVDLQCVLAALNAPTYVTTQMGQTRALDGRQTATWDKFEASWRYHPDNGLDVLFREV